MAGTIKVEARHHLIHVDRKTDGRHLTFTSRGRSFEECLNLMFRPRRALHSRSEWASEAKARCHFVPIYLDRLDQVLIHNLS